MAEGVSAKTLAVLLDRDERVVRRLAAEGIIVRAGRNQYLLAPSVRNYVRHLREVGGRTAGQGAQRRRRKRASQDSPASEL
jgi:phage terminase Nu1 subunit (DNA packaging protein)